MRKYLKFLLMLPVFLLTIGLSYASDYEVNKQEFNDKWQQTYNELAKSDPKAAEEFYRVTQEAFTQGEIAFANQKNEAVGDTIEGSATRPPAARIAETATLNQGIGLSNALDVALMTNENIKAEDIGKIREAMRVISLEASLVSWDSLSPQEKTLQEQSIERYFKEMTGCNMKEVFAPLQEGAVVTSVAAKTEVTGTLLQEAGTSGTHGTTETLSTSPQAIGAYVRPEENMPQGIIAIVGVGGAPTQGDWLQAVGDRHPESIAVPGPGEVWSPEYGGYVYDRSKDPTPQGGGWANSPAESIAVPGPGEVWSPEQGGYVYLPAVENVTPSEGFTPPSADFQPVVETFTPPSTPDPGPQSGGWANSPAESIAVPGPGEVWSPEQGGYVYQPASDSQK